MLNMNSKPNMIDRIPTMMFNAEDPASISLFQVKDLKIKKAVGFSGY